MTRVKARTGSTALCSLLSNHLYVEVVKRETQGSLQFEVGDWHRSIVIGDLETEVRGLIELMDNNPLVCADRVSVPGPVTTLALVALGPVLRAGMVAAPPIVQANMDEDEASLQGFFESVGWKGEVILQSEQLSLGGVVAVTAFAELLNSESIVHVDDLYDEAFGRSFYVRRCEEGSWDTSLVAGQPHAAYRLRVEPGVERSLLTVRAIGDREGKCGAAQIVHTMNVMCGFEESLGCQVAP